MDTTADLGFFTPFALVSDDQVNDGHTKPIPKVRTTHRVPHAGFLRRAVDSLRFHVSVWTIVLVLGVFAPLTGLLVSLWATDNLHYYHGGGVHGIVAGPDCGPNLDVEWGDGTIAFSVNVCS
jgi:hypothetical protein